jgi:hypothetical protein
MNAAKKKAEGKAKKEKKPRCGNCRKCGLTAAECWVYFPSCSVHSETDWLDRRRSAETPPRSIGRAVQPDDVLAVGLAKLGPAHQHQQLRKLLNETSLFKILAVSCYFMSDIMLVAPEVGGLLLLAH